MKNRQIIEMMRDIAPQYQQKANERAASVSYSRRRSILPTLMVGGAAIGCAAFAAAFILPNMPHEELVPPKSAMSEIQELTDINDPDAGYNNAPIGDLSEAVIRFVAPQYAPYALEITADQQRELAEILSKANWQQTGTEAINETGMPDGEYISMHVYDPASPLVMTFSLANDEVRILRCNLDSEWTVYEVPEAVAAVRSAAQRDDAELDGCLTWIGEDTRGTADFWKNFSIDPKVCDMTNKEDVFYKMSNSVDYFNRASGVVKNGFKCDYGFHADFLMQLNTFQVNVNMGNVYGIEEYLRGPDAETLINGGDGIQQDEAPSETAVYGTDIYYICRDAGEYTHFVENAMHRIDSEPIQNDQHHSDDPEDQWYAWKERPLLCACAGRFCLENYTEVLGYLYDFSTWDIVGTEVIDGRECVHIQGVLPRQGEGTPQVKDGAAMVQHFDLYADTETGVTVKLLGYDENNVLVRFIVTENLAFEDAAQPVQAPDLSGLTENVITGIEPLELPAEDAAQYEEGAPEAVDPADGDE